MSNKKFNPQPKLAKAAVAPSRVMEHLQETMSVKRDLRTVAELQLVKCAAGDAQIRTKWLTLVLTVQEVERNKKKRDEVPHP